MEVTVDVCFKLGYQPEQYRREVAKIATKFLVAHIRDQFVDNVSETDLQTAVDLADKVLKASAEKSGTS